MYRMHVGSSQQELQEADLSKVVLRPLELRPSQHESQMLDKELEYVMKLSLLLSGL